MTTLLADKAPLQAVRPMISSYSPSHIAEQAEAVLAHKYVTRAPKQRIQYEFTRDPGLLQQYYQLREEMFISVWGLSHFSGKKDHFDDISAILIARSKLQCVAGGRLAVSMPQCRQMLPMETPELLLPELFPELDLKNHMFGEFSRLAILPEFRAGAIFPEITRRFIKKAVSLGVEYAFNLAPVPLARSYRQSVQSFGLQWDIRHDIKIPDRDEYEGIRMVMSIMDLRALASSSGGISEESARSALVS